MTHTTDCEIETEDLGLVNDIAEEIFNRTRQGRYLDQDFIDDIESRTGWTYLDGGLSRVSFQISSEGQTGPTDTPVRDAPCIIKFAKARTGRNLSDGKFQNEQEIGTFQSMPGALTDPDQGVPRVMPLKDWDRDKKLWITAPFIDTDGGSVDAAESALDAFNWDCRDIHGDNVGGWHGETVLVDYGAECSSTGPSVPQVASAMVTKLNEANARSVDVQLAGSGGSGTIEFRHPDGVPGADAPTTSFVEFVADNIESERLAFGPFDQSGIRELGRDITDILEDEFRVDVSMEVTQRTDGTELVLNVLGAGNLVAIQNPADVYLAVIDEMQKGMGVTQDQVDMMAARVAGQLREMGARNVVIGDPFLSGVVVGSNNRGVRFIPPLVGATVGAPKLKSIMDVSEDGVEVLRLYFGAWPTEPSGQFDNRAFQDDLEQQFRTRPHFSISLVSFQENAGAWHLVVEGVPDRNAFSPRRAADIYSAVLDAAQETFPLSDTITTDEQPSAGAITRNVQGTITRAIARRARND